MLLISFKKWKKQVNMEMSSGIMFKKIQGISYNNVKIVKYLGHTIMKVKLVL